MNFIKTWLLLIIFIVCSAPRITACTSFVLKNDGGILLAKNLDWIIGDGSILINTSGTHKVSLPPPDSRSIQWVSKYSSITFNHFGKEFPLGGMNEKGLVIEELNYTPSQYPQAKHKNLNEFQWVQYNLDNHKSVKEVIEGLNMISISPFLFNLHYMICDAYGEIAIIEFIEGQMICYSGDDITIPVLTNNSYENLLKYIQNYKGFGGENKVSSRTDSQERFVRVATKLKNMENMQAENLIAHGFKTLESVKQSDTQWSIVYDVINRVIYYNTQTHTGIEKIQLAQFDNSTRIKFLNCPDFEFYRPEFEYYTTHQNTTFLSNLFNKYVIYGEIDDTGAKTILNQLISYSQRIK